MLVALLRLREKVESKIIIIEMLVHNFHENDVFM